MTLSTETQALIDRALSSAATLSLLEEVNRRKEEMIRDQNFEAGAALRDVERDLQARLRIDDSLKKYGVSVYLKVHRMEIQEKQLFPKWIVLSRRELSHLVTSETYAPSAEFVSGFLACLQHFCSPGAVPDTLSERYSGMVFRLQRDL